MPSNQLYLIIIILNYISASQTATEPTVLITYVGGNVTLPCDVSPFPEWSGPSPNGNKKYNFRGVPDFNQQVGSKYNRLKWGTNNADLVILNVVKDVDDGNYNCFDGSNTFQVNIFVRGRFLYKKLKYIIISKGN